AARTLPRVCSLASARRVGTFTCASPAAGIGVETCFIERAPPGFSPRLRLLLLSNGLRRPFRLRRRSPGRRAPDERTLLCQLRGADHAAAHWWQPLRTGFLIS